MKTSKIYTCTLACLSQGVLLASCRSRLLFLLLQRGCVGITSAYLLIDWIVIGLTIVIVVCGCCLIVIGYLVVVGCLVLVVVGYFVVFCFVGVVCCFAHLIVVGYLVCGLMGELLLATCLAVFVVVFSGG